jgi:alkanesulfonate monooxygenase SsuD/methylene tetrahydromethanopterin reductase-like flavin-dependent oxidoreductase (luciferase family)
MLKAYVADVRAKAVAAGRSARDVLIYNLTTVIVAETDEAAQKKFEEYQSYTSYDGALVFMSGWSGIDFGQYAPTDLVKKVETNAIVSMVESFSSAEKPWSIAELARWGGIGGIGPVFVGSAATVADILQEWVEETDVDGFNLAYAVTPETFEDTVNLLVPELQRRGVYPKSYRPGTLREKLFGRGPLLPETHPAHGYRDIEAVKAREANRLEAAE